MERLINELKEDHELLNRICDHFNINNNSTLQFIDSSHSLDDIRLNIFIDNDWVVKINSKNNINEASFNELNQVILNYRGSGIYAPKNRKSINGTYLYEFKYSGKNLIAYVEEYAPYPVCKDGEFTDKIKLEALIATADYMQKYNQKDLMSRYSMWSIIELPVLNEGIDEKEENFQLLVSALRTINEFELVKQLDSINRLCRDRIHSVFSKLRKCSIQGDLNASNILVDRGHFVGLIDFNMAGTEVNINNILNETRFDLKMEHFEEFSSKEIFELMTNYRKSILDKMFECYTLDAIELSVWHDYRKIIDLFLWPSVALWTKMMEENKYVEKIIELIRLIMK